MRLSTNGLLLLLLVLAGLSSVQAEDNSAPEQANTEESPETRTTEDEAESSEQSSEQPAPTPERVRPQVEASRHASVIHHLSLYQRQREVVQLVAGDLPFYGLFLQEHSGNPQGGVLILHDDQQHGHWPTITAPLREYLPDYGWATLAVELPSQPQPTVPERGVYKSQATDDTASEDGEAETEQPAPDQAAEEQPSEREELDSSGIALDGKSDQQQTATKENEPALPRLTGLPQIAASENSNTTDPAQPQQSQNERYQQQMMLRVEQGVNYLNSRGQFNLVIVANGNSASWAVDFLVNRQQQLLADDREVRGITLILIDPQQNPYNQLYLEQQLQQLEIPVLDLITDLNNQNPQLNKRRASMMKHRQRKDYRQIRIHEPNLANLQHQALKRRVRGWLKTKAAGTELAKN